MEKKNYENSSFIALRDSKDIEKINWKKLLEYSRFYSEGPEI